MLRGKRVLAVVPARSGSKGIPNKNLRRVAGMSLIAHAGRTLASLSWLDARIISTDSQSYADEGRQYGLDAPFLRPAWLSTDEATAVATVEHALLECERHYGASFDVVLIVEPTSPLRTPIDLEATTTRLLDSGADSVVTVSQVPSRFHPDKLLVERGERLTFATSAGARITARQRLSEGYLVRNGICYALTRDCVVVHRSIITDHTVPLLIEGPTVNIDEPLDLAWADFLLRGVPASPEDRD